MTVTSDRPSSAVLPPDGDPVTPLAEALFREARQRRRRRRLAAAAVVVIGALAVFLLVLSLRTAGRSTAPSSDTPAPTGGPSGVPAMPPQMVVWAQTGTTSSIQVISSQTGKVVRTLAPDVGLFARTPQPAAAPDGTVYYDQSIGGTTEQGPGAHPPVEQILSVPITGGPSTVIADGHDPAVSPDGQSLAYLTWTQITNGPEAVAVVNRLTGATDTWSYSTNSPDINTISWSPDSRSLVVSAETLVGIPPTSTWHLAIGRLRLADPNRSLDALPTVPLPLCPPPTEWASPGANREMAWAGFLNAVDGIGVCHHVGLTPQDNWTRPVVVNLATGKLVRPLPTVPTLLNEGPGGGFLADASGHHLVFIGDGLGAGGLYRWTVDAGSHGPEARPVFVKDNVGSAAWVPTIAR